MQMLSILLFHANETMEGNPPNLVKGIPLRDRKGNPFQDFQNIFLLFQNISHVTINHRKRDLKKKNKFEQILYQILRTDHSVLLVHFIQSAME